MSSSCYYVLNMAQLLLQTVGQLQYPLPREPEAHTTLREYDIKNLTKISSLPNAFSRQINTSDSESCVREAVSDSPQTTERVRYEAAAYTI